MGPGSRRGILREEIREEAVRDFGRVENAAGSWAAVKGLAWRGLETARDGGGCGENGEGKRVRGGD